MYWTYRRNIDRGFYYNDKHEVEKNLIKLNEILPLEYQLKIDTPKTDWELYLRSKLDELRLAFSKLTGRYL